MRVLLISPVAELDPPCGDITYTQTLLSHPPAGVEYETYDAALRRGALIEHARRDRAWREPLLTAGSKAINILRRRKLLYWEPFRFFSVRPGEYDLVHTHVFSARFLSLPCPLIVSCGAPQRDLYLNYRRYSRRRVGIMDSAERQLGRLLGVNCNSHFMPQAARALVYTEYFRDHLVKRRYADAARVDVIPIMHHLPACQIRPRATRRIGFVARSFKGKGGPVLLEAFEHVRRAKPDAELWIIGSPPELCAHEARRRGITWLPVVPRDRLLGEIMPTFDVFAYPTPHDCFSYVMLEAMACGAAIATSDYVSMPEAVDFGRAGLISPVGNAARLAENILTLLEPDVNLRYRKASRRRFEEHFSCDAVAPRILAAYELAISENRTGAFRTN